MNNPIREYRQTQIQTATQEQLILMMYEHAIRACATAREALPEKKYDIVSNNIIKAQDIVTELMVSLKMEAGPISQNLYRLYDYMNRRLIEANMKKNAAILQEIEKMLGELLTTWEEVFKRNAQASAAAARPPAAPASISPTHGGFSVSG